MLMAELHLDDDLQHPGTFGCEWKLHSFHLHHKDYTSRASLRLSDRYAANGVPMCGTAALKRKIDSGLAHWLRYDGEDWSIYDHRGVRTATGLLVWPHKASELEPGYTARRADAETFLASYNAWANGRGFGWDVADAMDDGAATVESCSGYYAVQDAIDDMLEEIDGRPCELVGDLTQSYMLEINRAMQAWEQRSTSAGVLPTWQINEAAGIVLPNPRNIVLRRG